MSAHGTSEAIPAPKLRLVGHKGADLIAPGNTVESFRAAVAAGVDTIEFDVLWLQDAHLPIEQRAPLVVAHDWADATRRTPLTLTEALDAFLEPPLDGVEIDLDIKLPGREEELVAALRERDLIGRAMVSTMELYSLGRILELAPELRRGWTYPKVTKDWVSKRWAQAGDADRPGRDALPPPRAGGASSCRSWAWRRCGSTTRSSAPGWRVSASLAGVELIAWTVDEEKRMRELVEAGVDGICSNDPRLFARIQA